MLIAPGRYLIRIDSPPRTDAEGRAIGRTRGWQARIGLGGQRYRSKLFSDGTYGGNRAAWAAAEAWVRTARRVG